MSDLPDLLERTGRFALDSLAFYKRLPKTPQAQVPGVQFLKASSSVAANYRAAQRARSRPEFTAKLGVVREEADECVYWLEYMKSGGIAEDAQLLSEAKQLCAIFTTAYRTAKRNQAT